MNDGLVYSSDKDSLTDPDIATVVNPSASEDYENYFYDITLIGRFFKDNNSLTKLKLYSNNSTRNLTNSDTAISISNYPPGFTHSVLYGLDILQNIFVRQHVFGYFIWR